VKVWLAAIVFWTAGVPAFAQTDIDGTGTLHGFAVSDGDTVRFGRQRVRLFGIDAPEKAMNVFGCDAVPVREPVEGFGQYVAAQRAQGGHDLSRVSHAKKMRANALGCCNCVAAGT
jgi:hypothetical protein